METKNTNAVVVFNGARQHSFSAQKDCLVTLNAGSNVVSVEKLNRLLGETGNDELDAMASESFVDMVAAGEIDILDEGAVVTAEEGKKDSATDIATGKDGDNIEINITKLGAKDGIALIEGEADAAKVQAYLDAENSGEPRKSVVAAAEKALYFFQLQPETFFQYQPGFWQVVILFARRIRKDL